MKSRLPSAAASMGTSSLGALLTAGVDLEECDERGRTAIFRAARVGKDKNVALLLASGANPNAVDLNGEAPLQAAARYGHIECVRVLIKAGSDVNYCPDAHLTSYSESALCSAVRKSHHEIVQILLEAGASPNVGTSAGRFPLLEAADRGDVDMIGQLARAGADLEVRSAAMETPLIIATKSNRIEAVKTLLKLGSDVNAHDKTGVTALSAAVSENEASVRLVFALLAAQPDLKFRDGEFRETPIDKAHRLDLPEIVDILRQAGSPPPKNTVWDELANGSITGRLQSSDGTVRVELQLRHPQSAAVSAADRELSRETSSVLPVIFRHLGWKASPAHWKLLAHSERAQSLTRLAYFVRGWFNVPAGKELDDGPKILGETYLEAAERFVSLGLLEHVGIEEALTLSQTVDSLKQAVRDCGLRPASRKVELATQLLSASGREVCKKLIGKGYYFRRTASGAAIIAERKLAIEAGSRRLRQEIIDALLEPSLRWGVLLAANLKSMRSRQTTISPERIAAARSILESSLPSGELRFDGDFALLQAAAAGWKLVSNYSDSWSDWITAFPPRNSDGSELSLSDVASMFSEFRWQEGE
jgi:ankyrin repeat protein